MSTEPLDVDELRDEGVDAARLSFLATLGNVNLMGVHHRKGDEHWVEWGCWVAYADGTPTKFPVPRGFTPSEAISACFRRQALGVDRGAAPKEPQA